MYRKIASPQRAEGDFLISALARDDTLVNNTLRDSDGIYGRRV